MCALQIAECGPRACNRPTPSADASRFRFDGSGSANLPLSAKRSWLPGDGWHHTWFARTCPSLPIGNSDWSRVTTRKYLSPRRRNGHLSRGIPKGIPATERKPETHQGTHMIAAAIRPSGGASLALPALRIAAVVGALAIAAPVHAGTSAWCVTGNGPDAVANTADDTLECGEGSKADGANATALGQRCARGGQSQRGGRRRS